MVEDTIIRSGEEGRQEALNEAKLVNERILGVIGSCKEAIQQYIAEAKEKGVIYNPYVEPIRDIIALQKKLSDAIAELEEMNITLDSLWEGNGPNKITITNDIVGSIKNELGTLVGKFSRTNFGLLSDAISAKRIVIDRINGLNARLDELKSIRQKFENITNKPQPVKKPLFSRMFRRYRDDEPMEYTTETSELNASISRIESEIKENERKLEMLTPKTKSEEPKKEIKFKTNQTVESISLPNDKEKQEEPGIEPGDD